MSLIIQVTIHIFLDQLYLIALSQEEMVGEAVGGNLLKFVS